MQTPTPPNSNPTSGRESSSAVLNRRVAGFTGLQVLGIVAASILVTAGVTYWVIRTYVLPADFKPVTLSQKEQVQLDSKLRTLGIDPPRSRSVAGVVVGAGPASRSQSDERPSEWLRSERYSEDGARREIGLSERELNALLAHNTDLARRLAVDLSDDLASARMLIPMHPDLPIVGGRVLRVAAGLELSYSDGRPIVILRGVSLMGVPIPNSWLGNLKNVDLVREFGGGAGVWKTFSDGVDFIRIRDGELVIRLKE